MNRVPNPTEMLSVKKRESSVYEIKLKVPTRKFCRDFLYNIGNREQCEKSDEFSAYIIAVPVAEEYILSSEE